VLDVPARAREGLVAYRGDDGPPEISDATDQLYQATVHAILIEARAGGAVAAH
jgi:hypothetical protein